MSSSNWLRRLWMAAGEAFGFEWPRDDATAYHVEIRSCAFVRFCAAEGMPEVGPLLCEFDASWIEAIDTPRHRLRFVRPTTIAWGDDRCRFYFDRE